MWPKILMFYPIAFLTLLDTVSGIVCYTCNSIILEACAMSLDETALPYDECKTDLQCIMSIVDSVTYRGCSSSTPTIGATYKKSCSSNLCNKGVYPPGRLKCYHCTGSDCIGAPEGKPHPCLSHHEEDECYTQVIDVNAVNRGCRSDSNRTLNDAEIQYCDINGCNNKPAFGKLICAQCDSANDRGCKMDLPNTVAKCNITIYKECEANVLMTQGETCFLYHNLNRVVRGCTRYIPEDIKMDVEHRYECNSTDFCNANCLKQQKCVVCDSNKNKDCQKDASTIPKNICGSAETSSCFACEFNDWHIERGCGLPPKDSENINRCYECDSEAGCNEKPLTRCYKCSTTANANCANWERPGYYIEIEECQLPGASCLMAVFPSGITQRGCHSSNFNCNDTLSSCQQCSGSFCNAGPYPPNRLRCYQCLGDDNCAGIDIDPLPCPVLTPDTDACFEFYDAYMGGMIRGCRSNAQLYYHCILHNGSNGCRVCYEDGCNNSPAVSEPSLMCYKCDKNDFTCQQDQSGTTNLKTCLNPVPFYYKEACYIIQHLDGTTSRGCSLDMQNGNGFWDRTSYCYKSACNFPSTISSDLIRYKNDVKF